MAKDRKQGEVSASKALETAKSKAVKESYHLKSDSRTGKFVTKSGESKVATVKR